MSRPLPLAATLLAGLLLQACSDHAASLPAVAGAPAVGAAAGTSGRDSGGSSSGKGGRASDGTGGGNSSGGDSSAEGGRIDAAAAGQDAAGAAAAGAPETCGPAAIAGLGVFSPGWDPLGYPPYAIDGCTLVYVAPAAGDGALRRRDLVSGDDVLLESAAAHPRRPTVAGDVIAWERDGDGAGDSSVSVLVDQPARARLFAHAGEPRATTDAVVFTKFLGPLASDDTDVVLYEVESDQDLPIAIGAGQQRFADVSASHVAVSDFSEDPLGYFKESGAISDVLVIDRKTGERTPRAAPGKQAFPLLGTGGLLVYLEWGAVHPEPKFSEFTLKAGSVFQNVASDFNVKGDGTVSTNPAYVRPSLHGVYLDFIDHAFDAPQLFRSTLDGPATAAPTAVSIAGATTFFGPVSAEALTLVATPLAGQQLSLVAVAR
jgi:hypothetical protein